MAEGFEPYHVPQQSRRDKLRVGPVEPAPSFHGLMMLPPPYDHLLTSPKDHNHNNNNLMSLVGSSSSTSSSSNFRNPYSTPGSDPQFHDHTFLYGAPSQILTNHDHEAVVFKPEPLSLSLSSYNTFGVVAANDVVVSRSSVPLGPFTGYASILKGSRFLRPAQQLLEEFCYDVVGGVCADKLSPDTSLMTVEGNDVVCDDGDDARDDDRDRVSGSEVGGEIRKKKSRLISMLDEVYRRYKQYYQQMQAVVTSFEYVSGLGNAAPYANLAVKAMTRHFRCLKNAIMDQLQFAAKEAAQSGHRKDEAAIFRGSNNRGPYGQRPVSHGMGFLEHQPVWRPQRGLPERAVSVLRAWLFEHFLHPYPTDTDKLMLAKQTGLSRSQVSNWFINARVRLWKPMVEEIHMLETRQAQKGSQQRDHMPPPTSENPSTSTSKRTRNELSNAADVASNDANLSYDHQLTSHLHPGAVSVPGGVSLTLGLHQNNHGNGNIVLSEPFPMNAAQRFGLGLEGSSDGFMMNTFEGQNRHFARDVLGGQLLHDFVG